MQPRVSSTVRGAIHSSHGLGTTCHPRRRARFRVSLATHPFGAQGRRLVFAHRGGAKLGPENTMAAFERGLACGSDGLECDVHLSKDGVPVVIHDATLDRTTNASGPVGDRTAAELAAVDAGYHFTIDGRHPYRGQGVGVPTLETVLRRFPGARVIVEMKQGDPRLARAVIEVLGRTSAADRVCVGSFHQAGLDVVRAEAPAVATSASQREAQVTLYRAWCRWPFGRRAPYCAFQVPERAGRLRVVSPAFVKQVHRAGARVDVWVIDRPEDMSRLFSWGVDGVITDRPDLAAPARDEWSPR
ncbi:MAG: glycerophosphodiester phosphodiesterase [Acidobacteriota bacterium]